MQATDEATDDVIRVRTVTDDEFLSELAADFNASERKLGAAMGFLARAVLHTVHESEPDRYARGAVRDAALELAYQAYGVVFSMADPDRVVERVRAELRAAREKHPGTRANLTATTEEVGELFNVLGRPEAEKEAIQVIAMCTRLVTEGDSSLGLGPAEFN